MQTNDYLSKEESEMIRESIHSQVLDLKEKLNDKSNFKEKKDWKEMSFVTEGDESG